MPRCRCFCCWLRCFGVTKLPDSGVCIRKFTQRITEFNKHITHTFEKCAEHAADIMLMVWSVGWLVEVKCDSPINFVGTREGNAREQSARGTRRRNRRSTYIRVYCIWRSICVAQQLRGDYLMCVYGWIYVRFNYKRKQSIYTFGLKYIYNIVV